MICSFWASIFSNRLLGMFFSYLENSCMPRVFRLMLVAILLSTLVPNMSLILLRTCKYEGLINPIILYLPIPIVSFLPNGIFITILLLDLHKLPHFYMHKLDFPYSIKVSLKLMRLKRCNFMDWGRLELDWLIMLIRLRKYKLSIT
jgi:hypothetical protein